MRSLEFRAAGKSLNLYTLSCFVYLDDKYYMGRHCLNCMVSTTNHVLTRLVSRESLGFLRFMRMVCIASVVWKVEGESFNYRRACEVVRHVLHIH